MIRWWKENAWKIRIKIYSFLIILIFPVEVIISILVFLVTFYRKFFSWLLWDAMHKVFCTKRPKEFWEELRRMKEK